MLVVHDPVHHRDHSILNVVLQNVYQHLCGYHTGDHADELSHEPLLTTLLAKEQLASQPSISCFNEKVDIASAKSLEFIDEVLQWRAYVIESRNQFVLDLYS
ncbi:MULTISPECIES: transposase [Paenibacillus]|uniref:transposase n=1 Tax=Paenibacillus TaxID=44249 RepID=UPI00096F539B|nr:transposase [Paenibacillus odorifer]